MTKFAQELSDAARRAASQNLRKIFDGSDGFKIFDGGAELEVLMGGQFSGCFSSKASLQQPTRPPPPAAASSRKPRARGAVESAPAAPPGPWHRQRLQLHAQQQREGGATMRACLLYTSPSPRDS